MGEIDEAFDRCIALEFRHSVRHDVHATFQSVSLDGAKVVGNANDSRGIGDQIVLAVEHRMRQQRTKFARKTLRRLPARDDLDEALRERLLLRDRQRRLVFDGVGDPAQQIGVAHHVAQRHGELRNGKGEGAGNALQDAGLVGEIAAGPLW